MSYLLHAYALDDAILAVIGSGDRQVLARVTRKAEQEHESFVDEDTAAEHDGAPSNADVMRHLIMGEPYDARFGWAYGYGFSVVCETFVEWLDEDDLWLSATQLVEQVDPLLAAAGIPTDVLTLQRLVFGGPPVPLPPVEDFPAIGHLTPPEVVAAHAALAAFDLQDVDDPDVRDSLGQVRSWLATCAEHRQTLVCITY